MAKKPDKLTEREQRFCEEFICAREPNGTRAAMRAGYTQNEKAASVQAARLLGKARVRARIDELKAARSKRTQVTADLILRELLKVATSDLAKAFDAKGQLRSIDQMPASIRRSIAAVKVYDEYEGFGKEREKVGETTEIKLWDKPKALELLGKHLKLFTDKVELSGKITLEQLVNESQRVEEPKKGKKK